MTSSTSHHTQIAIIVDEVRTASPSHFNLFSGWQWEFLRGKLLKAGFDTNRVQFLPLSRVSEVADVNVIVGLGEATLRHFTDKRGIDKWQLSPLTTPDGRKFFATYDLGRIQKQFELGLYMDLAFLRAHQEIASRTYTLRAEERFLLNPPLEEAIAWLEKIKYEPELAVDVETGYGQINTVGFAWSPSDAIAINVLPDRCGDEEYYRLWAKIAEVLEGPAKKIFQNFIYDVSYFSAYGIRTANIWHDTMWAMKVLWPELKSNLGNVGRIYTRRPYWKDDGKVTDEEGAKKSWGNIRDWHRHYRYNASDTTGTLEAARNQRRDLEDRGLLGFYDNYLIKLTGPILEACSNGMPVCLETRAKLQTEIRSEIDKALANFHAIAGTEVNPRSPRQLKNYLATLKIKLPKKYDKERGVYKESTDASSIKKVRLKHPNLKELEHLQKIKSLDKALSSYINFRLRPDGRLSYSLNGCGTETLRWSGGKDGWDRGFNIQTIPREGGDVSIKQMFLAPEGYSFVEVDLRQAESRFVAYDAGDKTLIDMLESGEDVHTYVGEAILRQMGRDPKAIPKAEFKATWRQLGKKAGHGLNYYMKPAMFAETVFNELDLVISKNDAELITNVYYNLFRGIPRWHSRIKQELWTRRKLTAPTGWERYFYGRYGDDMFKEAFAWRPQHTIPYLTNALLLHLCNLRKHGKLKFHFLVQTHDSLTLLAPSPEIEPVAKECLDTKAGHPPIDLLGGRMYIPREVKFGTRLSEMKEWGES